MNPESLDEAYWTSRWANGHTGWDIGYANPALIHFIEKSIPKSSSILIPGAGNGYEAIWLHENGWTNTTVLDISSIPLRKIGERCPLIPDRQLVHGDFFNYQGTHDFVLEQTFFCALPPRLRRDYSKKMAELLMPGGVLAGLLFSFPLSENGPPFGGSEAEYRSLLQPLFDIKTMETSQMSIKPRLGSEYWFEAVRRQS